MIPQISESGTDPTADLEITLDMHPQRDGYTFVEWNTEDDGTGYSFLEDGVILVSPNEVIELWAIWEQIATSYLVNEDGDAIVFGSDRILV